MGTAVTERHCSLCPRNFFVPSYRPIQRRACTARVLQFVPGSGEGQYTCTVRDSRRREQSRSGRPITGAGSGCTAYGLLCIRDAVSPSLQSTNVRLIPCLSSSASGSPAPLLPNAGETWAYRTPFRVLTYDTLHGPASARAPSTPCRSPVCSPSAPATAGRRDWCGETRPPLRKRPTGETHSRSWRRTCRHTGPPLLWHT
jgi:hypothetical protein